MNNRYSAQGSGANGQTDFAGLFANGFLPRIDHILIGSQDGQLSLRVGIKFSVFRSPNDGTAGAIIDGQLVNKGSDSVPTISSSKLKIGYSIPPSTPDPAMFSLAMFHKGMAEWTAKPRMGIRIAQTGTLFIQAALTGFIGSSDYSVCIQFEE